MGFLRLHMNQTCPEKIDQYIRNLTSSYTDKRNEPTMVSASLIMFILAGLFFNLNLFSGISDMSAILNPRVRLFLSSALSLFLTVMSYLFSEAKNAVPMQWTTASSGDLSVMAGLILTWMLLVELLRKKVDEIHMHGYSGTIMRAGRVIWLGNLVFFNIKSAGRKALFSILWILCATRVVQRIAYTEIGKRSYEHGKNPRLISSYMAWIMPPKQQKMQSSEATNTARGEVEDQQDVQPVRDVEKHQERRDNNLLRSCEYVVMGEAKLVEEATAGGYDLKADTKAGSVLLVGVVWATTDDLVVPQSKCLKRLCLSFALFKLLRRRVEHAPAANAEEEARNCRDLIFNVGGLHEDAKQRYNGPEGDANAGAAEAVLQVVHDEVNFLSEYYHSVVPVALASPSFFVVNYFFVLVVVALLCLMTVILCGNGDAGFAFRSIGNDNYVLRFGIAKLTACVFSKAIQSPSAFFSALDLAITGLLFAIYLYEEIWEFFVFLCSDWFMVSLLARYTASNDSCCCLKKSFFRFAIRCLIPLRSYLSQPKLSFRQFSALNQRFWPRLLPFVPLLSFLASSKELVHQDVKTAIIDHLKKHACGTGTDDHTRLSNGKNVLQGYPHFHDLSRSCDPKSVAEVILTWHIATSIFEVEHKSANQAMSRRVAISLSKYCAYLVAFHPELLPDNPEKTRAVVDRMKADLRHMLGCWGYYPFGLSKQVDKLKKSRNKREKGSSDPDPTAGDKNTKSSDKSETGSASDPDPAATVDVVREGKKLAQKLNDKERKEDAWDVLAKVWTELLVFVAPSSDEECIKAHEELLVQGGEFITVLWALTTHTGFSRPATN